MKKKNKKWWLLLRGVLGGGSAVCAFAAVARLDLAVANVLMFTMPLWTAALSFLVLGRGWDFKDLLMAMSCLLGVIMVSEIWNVKNLSTLQYGMLQKHNIRDLFFFFSLSLFFFSLCVHVVSFSKPFQKQNIIKKWQNAHTHTLKKMMVLTMTESTKVRRKLRSLACVVLLVSPSAMLLRPSL
jgi:hypothetical protein